MSLELSVFSELNSFHDLDIGYLYLLLGEMFIMKCVNIGDTLYQLI